MTKEQEQKIMQVFANNAANKLTIELMNGMISTIKKIMEEKNGN